MQAVAADDRAPGTRDASPKSGALRLTIESLAFGGAGLSRHNGKVIFVEDTLPGEEVLVLVEEEKKRYARARVLERLAPAPFAQTLPCPYASHCGACQWLAAPYELQSKWKKSFIAAALQRIARLSLPESEISITPSPELAAFRNRIKLKLAIKSGARIELAYTARGSHELVPIRACWIASVPINQALSRLWELDGHAAWLSESAAIYELELQSLAEGVSATFITRTAPRPPRRLLAFLKEATRDAEGLIWTDAQDEVDEGVRTFDEQDGLHYLTYGGQFQQVNLAANRLLRTRIRALAQAVQAEKIVDLYCGSGNLSLQLAAGGARVWGLELAPLAIACAAKNLERNKISGATYRAAAVAELFSVYPELGPGQVDLVIADPPRAGMPEAIPLLKKLAPRHIFYISCDPNTMARDVKELIAASYRLASVEGFDFFPHSYHIESLVHLERVEA